MRPIVLTAKSPLPAVSGGRQRIWHLVRAVAALGPGDLVVLGWLKATEEDLLADALPSWTITSVPMAKHPRDPRRRLRWLVSRAQPTRLVVLDLDAAVDRVAALRGEAPRLIVAMDALPIAVGRRLRRENDRLVYDLNDAEDVRLERAVAELGGASSRLGPRAWWEALRTRVDVGAWRRFQAEHVSASDLTLVCSDTDRERFAEHGRTLLVTNGAELRPLRPMGRRAPSLLFVGQLVYEPNERAAIRLATRVLPRVRAAFPEASARIVGAHRQPVEALRALPGVHVTGFVDDIEPEWHRASVLVVALGTGSGTRLKILEAFARGVPVVSTSIGAEGIAATDGVHLRIADSDEDLASAVVELLTDPSEAESMAARAHALVAERYQWPAIEQQLTAALRELVGDPTRLG